MSFTATATAPDAFTSVYVSPYSRESNGFSTSTAAPASGVWIAANRAIYVPVVIPRACVIRRFFWCNGATVGTNNLQAGIYDDAFASVLLGTSTLSAGASVIQYDNVTDTPINAGRYWLALWCNGTTATVQRSVATNTRFAPHYDEDIGALPATATPTQSASPFVPVFGFTTRATP